MVDAAVAAPATATTTAAAAALPAPTISLVIDTKAQRVLFAEAGKEAVDFLFCILALPIGTAARLLRDDGSQPWGAANMYDSAEKMDPAYMQSPAVRDALLNSHRHTLLQNPTIRPNHWPGSTLPAASPTSVPLMPVFLTYNPEDAALTAPTSSSPGGFVQGMATYIVMDDLTIAPISAMGMLSKLNGQENRLVLQEKSVQLGAKEGLDILKASLRSNTVLTDVFLSNNTTEVPVSKNKRARTSSGEENAVQEKNNKIPDYYI